MKNKKYLVGSMALLSGLAVKAQTTLPDAAAIITDIEDKSSTSVNSAITIGVAVLLFILARKFFRKLT